MSLIAILIPAALALGLVFLAGFFWANSQGQFDDLETPAHRILIDDRNEILTSTDSTERKDTNS